jgi:hypothetical protein
MDEKRALLSEAWVPVGSRAMRRRAIRLLVGTVLGCLTIAAPASARYLHLSEGRAAAIAYGESDGDAIYWQLGSCWHAARHVVRCSYYVGSSLDIGSGHPERAPRQTLVVALRDRALWAHVAGQPQLARRVGHV